MVRVPEYWPMAWAATRSTLSERLSVMILHHSPTALTLPKISFAHERLTRWLRESPEEKVHAHSHWGI